MVNFLPDAVRQRLFTWQTKIDEIDPRYYVFEILDSSPANSYLIICTLATKLKHIQEMPLENNTHIFADSKMSNTLDFVGQHL